jgi:RNA polymerase sigma-70 factor (ECF subfamily)
LSDPHSSSLPEQELIDRLRRRDLAALGTLFERHGRSMSTLARSMVRNETEAEDVVEEALVRAWQAAPRFRGDRGLRTWMLRITANLCRDRLRRRRFMAGSLDAPVPVDDPALRFEPVADWDQAIDQRTLAGRLDQAIARLPLDQREAVLLRHRLGLSHEEMVATLGVPLGTVKSRIARAVAALRAELRDIDAPGEAR